jgi:hypothetical protein
MWYMNNRTTLAIVAIVAALTLVTAVVATTTIMANSALAAGGPKAEKNFGQCKQDFPNQPCRNFHTGG